MDVMVGRHRKPRMPEDVLEDLQGLAALPPQGREGVPEIVETGLGRKTGLLE